MTDSKKRYSFSEYKQENPVTNKKETYTTITGIVTIILYYIIIIFPFATSWWKGKIGFNTLNNNKYNLVSTALRWSHKGVRVFIILLLVSVMVLYNQKGFFKKDTSLAIPLFTLLLIFSMMALTYIIPEKFILHNTIALVGCISAAIIVYLIDYIYSNKFKQSELEDITYLSTTLTIVLLAVLVVGGYNIYNNYVRNKPLFPTYIPTIRDILGFLEISVLIIVGLVFGILIKYPPL